MSEFCRVVVDFFMPAIETKTLRSTASPPRFVWNYFLSYQTIFKLIMILAKDAFFLNFLQTNHHTTKTIIFFSNYLQTNHYTTKTCFLSKLMHNTFVKMKFKITNCGFAPMLDMFKILFSRNEDN